MLIKERISPDRLNTLLTFVLGCFVFLSMMAIFVFGHMIYHMDITSSFRGSYKKISPILKESLLKRETLEYPSDEVWVPISSLKEKFIYLPHMPRPDSDGITNKEELLLKSLDTGEVQLVHAGEKIYLSWRDKVGFSSEETPFSMEIQKGDQGSLHISSRMIFLKKETKEPLYEKNESVILKEKENYDPSLLSPRDPLFTMIQKIKRAKAYPSDRLFEIYGGSEFLNKKGSIRVGFDPPYKDWNFVHKGDLFIFDGGTFIPKKEKTRDHDLMQIQHIDSQKCEVMLWDKSGIYSAAIKIPLEKTNPFIEKRGSLFSKIHPRTNNSITCFIEGRSFVLERGDWILKTKQGWRILDKVSDIKNYLAYALNGELFIFDNIEKLSEGSFFLGHLFNEGRTEVQEVRLLINDKKNLTKSTGAKKIEPIQEKNERVKVGPKKIEFPNHENDG